MLSPQFIRRVGANVRYWKTAASQTTDRTLAELDTDRQNLCRAVQYGLQIPETALGTAELVSQLFELSERRGYWAEWMPLLEQAIDVCPVPGDPLHLTLLNQLGFIHRLRRQLTDSIAIHRQVVTLAEAHDHPRQRAAAFFHLSNAYFDHHQHQEAGQYAEQALAEFERLSLTAEDKKMGAIFNILGLLAQARGERDTAEQLFNQSIAHWRRTDELTYLARTLTNLGLNFLATEQFAQALACLDEADEALETTASQLDKTMVAINRGVVYFERENWREAEAAYRQANSFYLQQSGDTYLQAMIANNLGCALMKQNRWQEADAFLTQSAGCIFSINRGRQNANETLS